MSMKVAIRQVDGITILDLSGRITLGEGSITLRDSVRDVLAKGSKKILLNLGQITYIDSSGIGELVSAFTSVKNAGGESSCSTSPRRSTTCSRSPSSIPSSTSGTTRPRLSQPSHSEMPLHAIAVNEKAVALATADT